MQLYPCLGPVRPLRSLVNEQLELLACVLGQTWLQSNSASWGPGVVKDVHHVIREHRWATCTACPRASSEFVSGSVHSSLTREEGNEILVVLKFQ